MAEQGRPKVFDAAMRKTLCGLVGMGFNRWQAAQHVGISRSTLYRAARRDPDFRGQLRKAELGQELRPLQQIVGHMSNNWRAAAWILERQKPNLYVRRAPDTVTMADVQGMFNALFKVLMEGVPESSGRKRVMENFEAFFERLGGEKRCSPRVRRAIRETELELEQQKRETSIRSTVAPELARDVPIESVTSVPKPE